MRLLVTGSSGHLGEALMRSLPTGGHDAVGLDVLPSPFTHHVGSIADRVLLRRCLEGVDAVLHAATLHKPHVATHPAQAFVDTNVTGTLCLLEAAVAARVRAFVFTSTTSAFGSALSPPPGAPAVWIDEEVAPVPRNIYGVTKLAAESLCRIVPSTESVRTAPWNATETCSSCQARRRPASGRRGRPGRRRRRASPRGPPRPRGT